MIHFSGSTIFSCQIFLFTSNPVCLSYYHYRLRQLSFFSLTHLLLLLYFPRPGAFFRLGLLFLVSQTVPSTLFCSYFSVSIITCQSLLFSSSLSTPILTSYLAPLHLFHLFTYHYGTVFITNFISLGLPIFPYFLASYVLYRYSYIVAINTSPYLYLSAILCLSFLLCPHQIYVFLLISFLLSNCRCFSIVSFTFSNSKSVLIIFYLASLLFLSLWHRFHHRLPLSVSRYHFFPIFLSLSLLLLLFLHYLHPKAFLIWHLIFLLFYVTITLPSSRTISLPLLPIPFLHMYC